MPKPSRRKIVLSFALVTIVATAMVAAVALPVGAMAGLAASYATGHGDDLPDVLLRPTTAQASYLYANDGKTLITTFYEENRRDVPSAQIPDVVRQAIIAAEDRGFYRHGGVDVRGVVRAIVANGTSGEVEQGASTLTMQYVRNVLKSDPSLSEAEREAATATTATRKITEARYAMALEKKLTKDEILTNYLNIAYFGAGAYGIAAAAKRYFSTTPAKLTLAQAALLAGLVQSPNTDSPLAGSADAALARRAYVLDSMVATGAISAEQAEAAKASKLTLKKGGSPNGCAAVPGKHNDWGFFCDYFVQWWRGQATFGDTPDDREAALRRGGYTIVASMDPTTQAAALAQSLAVYGYGSARALPIAAVQPGTGRVLAMAVNRHYSLAKNPKGQRSYPNTVNQLIAGSSAVSGYQAGSTYKMFTMLAALENDLPLNTGFNSPTRLRTSWPASGPASCDGYYCPRNASPSWMDGHRTMWNGFGRSVNTYFVWLEQQVGADKAVEMAQRLGITFRSAADADRAGNSAADWGSFTLGVAATTPLDLANAYATVAAEGMACEALPVTSIKDASGASLGVANPSCARAIDVDVARAATDAARCPVGQQSAFHRCDGGTATAVSGIVGRDVAGKTGSSDNNEVETFAGYTPQVAAAGMAANPDNPRDVVGARVAPSVNAAVARTMAAYLAGKPAATFTAPSRDIAYGDTVVTPPSTAGTPTRAPDTPRSAPPSDPATPTERPGNDQRQDDDRQDNDGPQDNDDRRSDRARTDNGRATNGRGDR
ncbi:transglycosylase domain-containing protein [Luedemannella helvata]|uniref:Transglycosylase domain-containing protein n=1 Tax=Luedemannella helvata TaxID=349315 RepID=A0ABP4WSL1_9ACTN